MYRKNKILYLFLIVSLFLASEPNICNYCKQLISNQWIVFEEKDYHEPPLTWIPKDEKFRIEGE